MVDRNKVITKATERKLGLRISHDDTGIVFTLFDSKEQERDSVYIEIQELKQVNKILKIKEK